MVNDAVLIETSAIHGKGVFAKRNIRAGEVLCISHVTLLHHNEQLPEAIAALQFPWNEEYYALCLSDVGSFFNHAKAYNAMVSNQNREALTQTFTAVRDVAVGEELFIYYNDAFEEEWGE